MHIQLNEKILALENKNFPLLISGRDGSGASHFSVCFMADLFKRGHKIVFFTALPAAKEELKGLLTQEELADVGFFDPQEEIVLKKGIILNSGEELDFIDAVQRIPDIRDRIILVKNMERYTHALLDSLLGLSLLVFSGDLDKTSYGDALQDKNFLTKIFFSQSEKYPLDHFIEPLKYLGVLRGENIEGLVSLQEG